MPQQESPKRGRGRPRDPARGEAIREATLELLEELGYTGLTMVDVAERAGVAKTTIYRRWNSKAEMVLDAIAEQVEPREVEETGDPIADLHRVIAQFYGRVSGRDHPNLPISPAELLREAELADVFHKRFVRPMREHACALAERAIEKGRLRADVDPMGLVDTLAATAIYKPVVLGMRVDPAEADAVFDTVMRGALSG